ncbi:MAG: metal ABC transporter permease [Deltaproteobacteria bacterium]|nr:metal ABC transporter permease [Deltaproteobacteria bacterium]
MSWWTDYEFMRNAIMAGAIVGALCAVLGVFVVQRNMAFFGEGLAHAAFGGVALGLLLDLGTRLPSLSWIKPIWVAFPFCILVAWGIGWVRNRGYASEGTAVGVFFSVSVALGIVFIHLKEGPIGDLEGYLFGNILAVRRDDVYAALGLAAVVAVVLGFTWKRMAYIAFDRELAQMSGIPVERFDYLLLTLMACVIVLSVRTVGVLLVSSFLVIPAATARLWGGTIFAMTIKSVILGVLGSVAGLVASFYVDVPSGATVILTLAAAFGLAMVGTTLVRRA